MRRDWLTIAGYALAFWATHRIGLLWGGSGYYSLWFPAAGVRLALLWRCGTRMTFPVMLAELLVQSATGVVDPGNPDWLTQAVGVIRPPLAYGLAVSAVRRATSGVHTSLATPPMPLGLAIVAAPMAAVVLALPWSLFRPDITHVNGGRDIIASLTGFAVGDLLGVLLLAPPLLWLADFASGDPSLPVKAPGIAQASEMLIVLGLSFGVVAALARIGLGLPGTPVLLAVAWIGVRFGRAPAWSAILLTAVFVLPYTVAVMPIGERLALHMNLAAVTVVGYLAGSFADADRQARAALARRDRMLFQAERLKTLRAMSVAVIHEISQPLSTLAIEARHLREIAVRADTEIAEGAALIDRKAAALSMLVRRLRRFGGRAVDEPSLLPISALLDMVEALTRPEANAARILLEFTPADADLAVMAQEVELAQALVNLVRNAVQACDGGVVRVTARHKDDRAVISITNHCSRSPLSHSGMGIGMLVARAIVEAHGGHLFHEAHNGTRTAHIDLPLAEEMV